MISVADHGSQIAAANDLPIAIDQDDPIVFLSPTV
jgi:hypothetical protein